MRLNSAEYQVATEPPEAVPALKLSAESASRPLGSVHELRPALAAQRAVAAVMDVVEIQLASHLQSAPSVRLQMKLGGEELSIKVALAGGEVRTQFHTDSAELRSALEYQWNVTRAEAPERTLRYLDPEFHGTGAGLSHGGGGSPHDEPAPHPQARLAAQEVFGEIGRSYVPGAGPAAPDLPLPPSHTSVHLHAVA